MIQNKKVLLNLVLTTIAFCLVVALYRSWDKVLPVLEGSTPFQIDATDNGQKLSNIKRLYLPQKKNYLAVSKQNLFSPDRKEYVPVSEEDTSDDNEKILDTVKLSGEDVVLFAVIQTEKLLEALISNPASTSDRKNKWVKEGDKIEDLIVKQISLESISFFDGSQTFEIELRNKSRRKKTHSATRQNNTLKSVVSGNETTSSNAINIKATKETPQINENNFETVNTPFGKITRRKK